MPLLVLADDCNHKWTLESINCEQYSADKHKVTNYYYCEYCGEKKELNYYEMHNWQKDIINTEYKSETNHEVTYGYYCYDCGADKTEIEEEKHCLNEYNHCTKCYSVVPKNITLKPNKKAFLNNQSWAKVKVNQKGYLRVYTDNNANWGLYDRYKLPYDDAQWMNSKMCVPVKKGTYYLKVINNDSCVKFTFIKKSPKYNGKRSKAVNLKKNKALITLAYPPAKKNTWIGYYKVKIPKKQFLRLLISEGYTTPGIGGGSSVGIKIYNAKGKNIPCERRYGTGEDSVTGITSYEKLKKGTYYIKLTRGYSSGAEKERCLGNVISLKWVNRRIW